jgi:3-oxosteroid 1-dehydrogenase
MAEFDKTVDVVIVGTGAAGLIASLVVKEAGYEPLLVEKSDKVGGSSAMSGGGLWIPNNPLMRAAGVPDSFEAALTYLKEVIEDVGPASSPARKEAFLRGGPAMVGFLQGLGYQFIYGAGYPDYYPERPGGSAAGRGIESEIFNGRKLGPWLDKLRGQPLPPLHTPEVAQFALSARTVKGFFTAANIIGVRMVGGRLLGRAPLGAGRALVAQLLHLVLQRSIPIWLESPLAEVVSEAGAAVGVVVEHEGRRTTVAARRGVLLAAGGFAHNDEMRQKYHQHPITTEWTSASATDTGDGVRAGMALGAATALMDDAWWGPSVLGANGKPGFILWERSFPSSIIVDSSGQRFMNESASYVDDGHWQYQRNETVPAIPAWLVIDAKHRRRYPFSTLLPGLTPRSAISSGFLKKADTLPALAAQLGVDPAGLVSTVERFNGFARQGRDEDFHRGDSAYDRYYGDPRVKPNPNLGTIDKAPYYATAVYPGDLGTKGGLLTDEHARVLLEDGTPIPGLYAAGNTTASVMGRTYPGPGSTLGPATTFAYLAMRHATA